MKYQWMVATNIYLKKHLGIAIPMALILLWLTRLFYVSFALQIIITQFGGKVFGTVPLEVLDWLKVLGVSLSIIVLDEVVRLVRRLVGNKKAARNV